MRDEFWSQDSPISFQVPQFVSVDHGDTMPKPRSSTQPGQKQLALPRANRGLLIHLELRYIVAGW